MKTSYLHILCFIWLLSQFSIAQQTSFNALLEAFEKGKYKQIKAELDRIDSTNISTYDKATLDFYYAEYFNDLDKHDLAFKYVIAAKTAFIALEEYADVSDCNMLAISILNHQNTLKDNEKLIKTYIDEELKYLEGENDSLKLANIYFSLGNRYVMSNERNNAIKYYIKAQKIFSKEFDSLSIADCYENIATSYNTIAPVMIDSALHYSKIAEQNYKQLNNSYALAINYNNQSRIYKEQKQYDKSIIYLLKADSLPITENVNKTKLIFYENLAEVYGLTKNYDKQSIYLKKQLELRNIINDLEQNISISDIEEKYQNEKLRADNLEIESKRLQNRNIAIALGVSLVLVSIIAFLVYQNKQRKQKLILQEKEVKAQKLQSQLKEEELKSINAMIEGQEKERQRIANDLHDDLGSLMANIKIHFSTIKTKDSDNLYKRTNALIEEAYQKIRNIAHAKNSGVLAKQGLYEAIKKHAKSVSASKQISINVMENGLEERLENSVELTIFRIIQELITNVIKHAQASELDIHLNQHEDTLNIIVEDNGVGFDNVKPRKESSGMGLSSIERRVEDMGGTVIIESQPKNGTSVIMDIPI
jgi:signal transduction histidine kinase